MNILIVEDEHYVAEMLSRALEALGHSCVIADGADAADTVIREQPVDAVTLDLGMPGRSGISWLEGLVRARPDLARQTLVITGRYLDPRIVERLGRFGAGILAKPFTSEALEEAVRNQIDRPGPSSGN